MTGDSRAEEVFAQFLARQDAGEALSFEDWVKDLPQLEPELRALRRRWESFSPVLERLRGAPSAGDERAAELLRRLTGRSPAGSRFEERGEIGHGGMGVVLRVWDPELERELALKVTRDDAGDEHRAWKRTERFLEEARIAGQLQHPGIVPVHELGLDQRGRVYYTMPLIQGDDLEHVFECVRRGEGSWTRLRALGFLLRVCETMAYAHARGVVHGDLKPANVRVGLFGEVYVMDWGLARVVGGPATGPGPADESHGTSPGLPARGVPAPSRLAGTPAYLAPERLLAPALPPDPRDDVYAVGAMLYRLLAGRPPHAEALDGARDLDELRAAVGRAPRPLHELARDIPPELVSIAARALASRSERYAGMEELAADLCAFLENRVVRAHATGALVELEKWVARNRGMAAALLGVCVSVTLGALVSCVLFLSARAEKERVLRLADLKRHDELVERAGTLWPALPQRARDFELWLVEARDLMRRLPLHRATLDELRLEARVSAEGVHEFGTPEARWQHSALAELVGALEALGRPGTGLLADLERRLAFARTVEERTVTGPGARAAWERAQRSIADAGECPAYAGLWLAPQLGLVPLGPDPGSGLWEFAHLESGVPPARGGDGRLALAPESAIVLVLVPAGEFLMGAQAEDPGLPNHAREAFANEGPPHEVALEPFFLSKHELTQAQWLRLAGASPSTYAPGPDDAAAEHPVTLMHPVETVGRGECLRVLSERALDLPTEAQWEYAARAGTSSSWWTGPDPRSLQGAANLADQAVVRAGGEWPQIEPWLDDGYYRHAPVDALRANPFGLHHVHGNVWEWCRDDFGSYTEPVRAGDGLRLVPPGLPVGRGGGYVNNAAYCRSSLRDSRPDAPHVLFGVRPARRVDP